MLRVVISICMAILLAQVTACSLVSERNGERSNLSSASERSPHVARYRSGRDLPTGAMPSAAPSSFDTLNNPYFAQDDEAEAIADPEEVPGPTVVAAQRVLISEDRIPDRHPPSLAAGAKPDRQTSGTSRPLSRDRRGVVEPVGSSIALASMQSPVPGQVNLEAQPGALGDSQIMIGVEPLFEPATDPFPPYAESSLIPSNCPPIFRTWSINHFWSNSTVSTTIERNELLFPKRYYKPIWRFAGDIYADAANFYSTSNLWKLGVGLGVGAVFANTSIDQDFRDWYQEDVVQDPNQFHWAKYLGEGEIVVPLVVGSWLIGDWFAKRNRRAENSIVYRIARWGERSFRGFAVGFIPMVTLQVLTGASRPNETAHGSAWRPFNDNNGVSGHAFTSAVPFIVAAKMTESPLLKATLYFGSILGGYSRIHDDAHFLSQVMLGWLLAELSVQSVFKSESNNLGYRIVPLDILGHYGFGVEFRR